MSDYVAVDIDHVNALVKAVNEIAPDRGGQLTAVAATLVVLCKRHDVSEDNCLGILCKLFLELQPIFSDGSGDVAGHA
jgi:hypothetical protein